MRALHVCAHVIQCTHMEYVMYERDYRWMGAKSREWRQKRRMERRLRTFDRALIASTIFALTMCVVAYVTASYVIAEHARDFCYSIAECPKV